VKRTTVLLIIAVVLFILVIPGCSPKPGLSPTSATLPAGQEPVSIVSVIGPIPPYNPGGPVVEITLKNVSVAPVIVLTAGLGINRAGPSNTPFNFSFQVTSDNPLSPGKSISARQTLIGGGFSDGVLYPLTINGTLQSGAGFAYTKQVLIEPPAK
jgi:hypothetical protein